MFLTASRLISCLESVLRGSFTNYVDKILAFFDHLPSLLSLHFLPYKSWHFQTTYPSLLINVVCERPLVEVAWQCSKLFGQYPTISSTQWGEIISESVFLFLCTFLFTRSLIFKVQVGLSMMLFFGALFCGIMCHTCKNVLCSAWVLINLWLLIIGHKAVEFCS